MTTYLFLGLIILLASFLESTLNNLELTTAVIIALAVFEETKIVFLVAFFLGIFLDLLKGNPLGFSSFLFLIISGLIFLYQRRLKLEDIRLLLPFGVLILLAVNFFLSRPFLIKKTFFESLFLLLTICLFKTLKHETFR